jgi:hypothetical protein
MTVRLRIIVFLFGVLCPGCFAQTPIDIEPVKELKPTGTLGTCTYRPTDKEAAFYQKLRPSEQRTGSFLETYTIHGKEKQYVSWFGINRGVVEMHKDGTYTLRLEHKFFDGETDCHIMLVSKAGGGDFSVTLNSNGEAISPLVLLRVYGTVTADVDGVPHLAAQYVRVWPWLTFTFADLGPDDRGNLEWKKYCSLCKSGRVYRPYPDRNYYFSVLGDPKDFGTVASDR